MKTFNYRLVRHVLAGIILGSALAFAADAQPYTGAQDDVSCLSKPTLAERLEFVDAERTRKLLRRPDDWARQLSDFERSARLRTLEPVSTMEFLRFAGEAGLDWEDGEVAYWSSLADVLSAAAEGLNLRMPKVNVVVTTGAEEFYAAYARHESVVLPVDRVAIAGDVRRDFFLLAHELFHVLSGVNTDLRNALYSLLGFEQFTGFEYPFELESRRLSNPGAHFYDHALTVQTPDGPADVVPVIQSTVPLEEIIQLPTGGPPAIFSVLDILLLPVDIDGGDVLRDAGGNVVTYGFGNTNWPELMARNSPYIIHPEELMADNFALLMEWRSSGVMPIDMPSGFPVNDPELLVMMEDLLTAGCRP